MNFTLDDLTFLTSPRGEGLLARLADADLSNAAMLALITGLRRDYDTRETSAALELAAVRRLAVGKFGADAARMFFTRDALEQASHPAAREWHAVLASGATHILDVCSGIGADALDFARHLGVAVTSIDSDPLRVELARLNATACGLDVRFIVGDARALPADLLAEADMIFFDPARRDSRGRVHHVESYDPPLSTIRAWADRPVMAKLSPGVQMDQLMEYVDQGAGIDFISVDGELKETVLRLAPHALPHSHASTERGEGAPLFMRNEQRRAVMSLKGVFHVVVTDAEAVAPLDDPRGWLVEPDPAIIRAGAVAQIAVECGGALLDAEIAYFTTDDPPVTEGVRAWRIREELPFSVKRLRARLRALNIGNVTVKKRGTAVTPEALIPQLKLKGGESCTLVLTRKQGQQIVLVCDNYQGNAKESAD